MQVCKSSLFVGCAPIPAGPDQSLLTRLCSVPQPSFEGAVFLKLYVCGLLGFLVIEPTSLARAGGLYFSTLMVNLINLSSRQGVHMLAFFVAFRHGVDLVFH